MADLKPLFLEVFENAHNTIQAIAAQEVKPLPKTASPDTQTIFYTDLWEKYARMVSMLKEISHEMGKGLHTIQDLTFAKDPDVERLAFSIWMSHCGTTRTPQDAFKSAEQFVNFRNQRRQNEGSQLPIHGSAGGSTRMISGIPTVSR